MCVCILQAYVHVEASKLKLKLSNILAKYIYYS